MTLTTRLWLSGVLLPVLIVSSVLFGADRFFHWELERALDRALLAQAAIESVSLFDGPRHEPHLHMATSPLVESVSPFAPEGVLFGPEGQEVMRFPPRTRAHAHETLMPQAVGAPPRLTTHEIDGQRMRVLVVSVASPQNGAPYTLRLTAALAQIDAATDSFHRMALLAVSLMTALLVIVQVVQGRSLRRRLRELSDHVNALRTGDLDHRLADDAAHDELSALRGVLVEATSALKTARETKERLLADAAHELRTPLTVMRTSLDLALRRERTTDELKDALRDTRDEVVRLADLSSRLLDMVATPHNREPRQATDLRALAAEAVDRARAAARERSLEISLDAESAVAAPVQVQAVRRAVDNLLTNAIKHARTRIQVAVIAEAERVRFTVTDDGPGIAVAERDAVFEPFHRVPGSPPGAGLGLAIVREVARAHGGDAQVAETTQGATLIFDVARSA